MKNADFVCQESLFQLVCLPGVSKYVLISEMETFLKKRAYLVIISVILEMTKLTMSTLSSSFIHRSKSKHSK